jgi:signal-induced proliferation-associated 1 like protein 3
VVPSVAGAGVLRPFGEVVDDPVVGPVDVPGALFLFMGLVAELPLVPPVVPAPLPLVPLVAPLVPLVPLLPLLLPLPPELCAIARLADNNNNANDVPMTFMSISFPVSTQAP